LIHKALEAVSAFIVYVIGHMGYPGVMLLMGIESACIPLPSEVIMPFSGYLVAAGRFTVLGLGLAGAIGCVLGSIPAYYLGKFGGRHFIEKHLKLRVWRGSQKDYFLVLPRSDLDRADRLFQRHGGSVVFFGRLLPVVRTFIAFPAGVSSMPMRPFILYTFAGSFPWCLALAYVGAKLGANWADVKPYFHRFDVAIAVVIVAGAVYFLKHHLEGRARETSSAS
jgi:membrane protein DedA with SNARE-associated domain